MPTKKAAKRSLLDNSTCDTKNVKDEEFPGGSSDEDKPLILQKKELEEDISAIIPTRIFTCYCSICFKGFYAIKDLRKHEEDVHAPRNETVDQILERMLDASNLIPQDHARPKRINKPQQKKRIKKELTPPRRSPSLEDDWHFKEFTPQINEKPSKTEENVREK